MCICTRIPYISCLPHSHRQGQPSGPFVLRRLRSAFLLLHHTLDFLHLQAWRVRLLTLIRLAHVLLKRLDRIEKRN